MSHIAKISEATPEPKPHAELQAPLLTVEQVAGILNLSVRTVRRLVKDNKLPIVRIGRAVRVRPEVLAALIRGE